MSGFATVGFFLFTLLFSLATFILWVRIALCYFHVSSLHAFSRHIAALTDPIVKPITNLLTSAKNRRSRYDLACILVLCVTEVVKFLLFGALFLSAMMPTWLLGLYVLADFIVQPCNLLFYAILIRVIMSWVNPRWHNPLADVLRVITEPLLKPIQQHVPIVAGLDISPYLALIGLKSITLFVTASLPLHLI